MCSGTISRRKALESYRSYAGARIGKVHPKENNLLRQPMGRWVMSSRRHKMRKPGPERRIVGPNMIWTSQPSRLDHVEEEVIDCRRDMSVKAENLLARKGMVSAWELCDMLRAWPIHATERRRNAAPQGERIHSETFGGLKLRGARPRWKGGKGAVRMWRRPCSSTRGKHDQAFQ